LTFLVRSKDYGLAGQLNERFRLRLYSGESGKPGDSLHRYYT